MKIIVEIELDNPHPDGDEFPPYPTVKSVKVNGEEVEKRDNRSGRNYEVFWDLRNEDDGMSLVVAESWY